jgi:osmoprotectant transport system ATP-binding protein
MELSTPRRQIGYVIQQVGLFPHMTVAQNVAVVPDLLKWEQQRMDARIDELLDLVGLPPREFRKRYPSQLSGGQQQRVGLARALAADPKVMLMDEPFGAIDAITRSSLQEEMLRLQQRLHKTVLFVTHDVDEALRLADRIVIMRAGQVVQYDEPCVLLNNPADEFVRELLNSDDRVRQLSMLRVESAMIPLTPGFIPQGEPSLPAGADLRRALSLLLQPRVSSVLVQRDGQFVGRVTLAHLREAGCDGEAL